MWCLLSLRSFLLKAVRMLIKSQTNRWKMFKQKKLINLTLKNVNNRDKFHLSFLDNKFMIHKSALSQTVTLVRLEIIGNPNGLDIKNCMKKRFISLIRTVQNLGLSHLRNQCTFQTLWRSLLFLKKKDSRLKGSTLLTKIKWVKFNNLTKVINSLRNLTDVHRHNNRKINEMQQAVRKELMPNVRSSKNQSNLKNIEGL
jgi:hypothetical protein